MPQLARTSLQHGAPSSRAVALVVRNSFFIIHGTLLWQLFRCCEELRYCFLNVFGGWGTNCCFYLEPLPALLFILLCIETDSMAPNTESHLSTAMPSYRLDTFPARYIRQLHIWHAMLSMLVPVKSDYAWRRDCSTHWVTCARGLCWKMHVDNPS